MAWEEFGKILKSKAGKLYIKIDDEVESMVVKGKNFKGEFFKRELKGGDCVVIQNCLDEIDNLEAKGHIDEAAAEKRRSLFGPGGKCEFIKYILKIPPSDEK